MDEESHAVVNTYFDDEFIDLMDTRVLVKQDPEIEIIDIASDDSDLDLDIEKKSSEKSGGSALAIPTFKCFTCSLEYPNQPQFINHMKTHANVMIFQCDYCLLQFERKMDLVMHNRIHKSSKFRRRTVPHPSSSPRFPCDQCTKSLSSKRNLRRHQQMHLKGKIFECEVCSKQLTSRAYLKEHIKTHLGKLGYHCEKCMKYFQRESQLLLRNE